MPTLTRKFNVISVKISTGSYMECNNLNLKFIKKDRGPRIARSDQIQISRSIVSDSLGPHESQHTRPPCPSRAPRVHWDSRPSSQWCHPAISSSAVSFSSCPQSLPASESLFFWAPKSLQMVTAARKLKDAYSLEEKLWPT